MGGGEGGRERERESERESASVYIGIDYLSLNARPITLLVFLQTSAVFDIHWSDLLTIYSFSDRLTLA